MKKPTAYLQKKEMFNQALLDVGMDTGFQKCWDLVQCVLNDPEVMGKDTFGRERIGRIFEALHKYESEYGDAWLQNVDSDVMQEHLDRRLRQIHGDQTIPFKDRYPFLKKPNYNHGKKGWR